MAPCCWPCGGGGRGLEKENGPPPSGPRPSGSLQGLSCPRPQAGSAPRLEGREQVPVFMALLGHLTSQKGRRFGEQSWRPAPTLHQVWVSALKGSWPLCARVCGEEGRRVAVTYTSSLLAPQKDVLMLPHITPLPSPPLTCKQGAWGCPLLLSSFQCLGEEGHPLTVTGPDALLHSTDPRK